MRTLYSYFMLCLAATVGVGSLPAASTKVRHFKEELHDLARNNNTLKLGQFLRPHIDKTMSLEHLLKLARRWDETKLRHALKAAVRLKKQHPELKIRYPDFVQTALFIEQALVRYALADNYYFSKRTYPTAYTVDYDKVLKRFFIILDNKEALIYKGGNKTRSKAILYSHKNPKVVVRNDTITEDPTEYHICQQMYQTPGLIKVVGFTQRKQNKRNHLTLYTQLYRRGSLQTLFNQGYKFSLYEKIKLALDLVKGIQALHFSGFAHRDIQPKNCLIDSVYKKHKKRQLTAVIGNLSSTMPIYFAAKSVAQKNPIYYAPEAYARKNLKFVAYQDIDIFALGCVFYQLLHGKQAPWQQLAKEAKKSPVVFKQYLDCLRKHTVARRCILARKLHPTPQQEFELMILRMVHVNPDKRGHGGILKKKLQRILTRLS